MYVSISGLTAPYGNLSSRRAKVLVSFFVVPSASLSLVLLLAEAMGSTSSPYSSPRTHLSVPLEDLAAARLKVPTPCHPLLSSQGPQGTLCVGANPFPQVLAPFSLLDPLWRLPQELGPKGKT